MAIQPIYVPVLKGREGEYAALEALGADVRSSVMPLIEIPDVPYDYANERPMKGLDEHVSGIAARLWKSWHDGTLYLDLPWFGAEEQLSDGRVVLDKVLTDCASAGVKAVPVVSRASSNTYVSAAARYSLEARIGACIRLVIADFEEDVDLDAEVTRLTEQFNTNDDPLIDLVLDLEDLGEDTGRAVLVARSLFSMIPKRKWRKIVLAAASFPEDLSSVDAAAISKLPRREWDLWKTLQKRPSLLPSGLIFGDYAIAHPVTKELDPRTMRMSASIRYTTHANWLVAKGRNVRQYGFDQYFELCKALVARPEYFPSDFSWGDRYIRDCADGMTGPGNATTWRKVGTNHHITLVARELASMTPGA